VSDPIEEFTDGERVPEVAVDKHHRAIYRLHRMYGFVRSTITCP